MEKFNRNTAFPNQSTPIAPPFHLQNQHSQYSVQVRVPTHRISEQLELYHWRILNKDELISFQWIKAEPISSLEALVTIRNTRKLTTLDQIKQIRGNHTSKNIAKIFSSFQLLHRKFGPFLIDPKMIAFDLLHNPYIWMNKSHQKNEYQRDFISQAEFTANILALIRKYYQIYDNKRILYYCCRLTDSGYGLKQMAEMFRIFQEEEDRMRGSQMLSSRVSRTTLCFSKQFNMVGKKDSRNWEGHSQAIYHSHFKTDKKTKKPALSRTASDHVGSYSQKHPLPHSSPQPPRSHHNKVTLGMLTETEQSFYLGEDDKMTPVLEMQEEFFLSVEFEEETAAKEIVQLQKLDKFKYLLTKSIISESTT